MEFKQNIIFFSYIYSTIKFKMLYTYAFNKRGSIHFLLTRNGRITESGSTKVLKQFNVKAKVRVDIKKS